MPSLTRVDDETTASPVSLTVANASVVTMPAPLRPTITMNKPIPAEMPSLRFLGTLLTRVSLNLKIERMMKITPSKRIAVNATFHGSVMPCDAS